LKLKTETIARTTRTTKKNAFEASVIRVWSKAQKGKLKAGMLDFDHCGISIDHLSQYDGDTQPDEPPSDLKYSRPILQITAGEALLPIPG
jgi:hypothetical protein